jgi:hypothetical protein
MGIQAFRPRISGAVIAIAAVALFAMPAVAKAATELSAVAAGVAAALGGGP